MFELECETEQGPTVTDGHSSTSSDYTLQHSRRLCSAPQDNRVVLHPSRLRWSGNRPQGTLQSLVVVADPRGGAVFPEP